MEDKPNKLVFKKEDIWLIQLRAELNRSKT